MFSFPGLDSMALLSPGIQSTPRINEAAVLALLDQCWYSQSILKHSIALFVLSVESETVVRCPEDNVAESDVSLAEQSSTSPSTDMEMSIVQEMMFTESSLRELPRTSVEFEKSSDWSVVREALAQTRTGDLAYGETSVGEVASIVSQEPADGLLSDEEPSRNNAVDHVDEVMSSEESTKVDAGDQESSVKQVFTKYTVTQIPGDGRCLFRAVAHGSSLRGDAGTLDDAQQRDLADELRLKVADELLNRRAETEWFIEDDFEVYVNRIKNSNVWGGETEILMLSHVLKTRITVFMADRNTKGGLIAICEYGLDYGTADPIQVLYDGFGHYDAVTISSEVIASSKL